METQYTLELQGPIFPDAALRLCELFPKTQSGQFSVFFNINKEAVVRETSIFNKSLSISPLNDSSPSSSIITETQDEGAGWIPVQMRQKCTLIGTIKKVTYSSGVYTYEMST